jgi:hypothetical protein
VPGFGLDAAIVAPALATGDQASDATLMAAGQLNTVLLEAKRTLLVNRHGDQGC